MAMTNVCQKSICIHQDCRNKGFMFTIEKVWDRVSSPENQFFKVGDKSLIIHKSAYHLFSLLISKRGFPSLQTRKTFGKIMSGNYRFLIPVIRVMAHNCEFLLH